MRALRLILGLFGAGTVLAYCSLDIPLNAANWTSSSPDGENIGFFCNQSLPSFECPLVPPNHPSEWIQLMSPASGRDELVYQFPEECFPWSYMILRLINVGTMVDVDPSFRQNATMTMEVGGATFYLRVEAESNWMNMTQSTGPDSLITLSTMTNDITRVFTSSGRQLKIALHVKNDAQRTITLVAIGQVTITLYD
jgi:hypothetical protein